jgi:hypothetical protein
MPGMPDQLRQVPKAVHEAGRWWMIGHSTMIHSELDVPPEYQQASSCRSVQAAPCLECASTALACTCERFGWWPLTPGHATWLPVTLSGSVWTRPLAAGWNTFTDPQSVICPGSTFITNISHHRSGPSDFTCGTPVRHAVGIQVAWRTVHCCMPAAAGQAMHATMVHRTLSETVRSSKGLVCMCGALCVTLLMAGGAVQPRLLDREQSMDGHS